MLGINGRTWFTINVCHVLHGYVRPLLAVFHEEILVIVEKYKVARNFLELLQKVLSCSGVKQVLHTSSYTLVPSNFASL